MTWEQAYLEIKSWQHGIGSLLALGGLIIAALFNAHLNRRRDRQVRADEAHSVAAALYGEIIHLREQLAKMANGVARQYFREGLGVIRGEPYDKHFLQQVALPTPVIYPALAGKIGILAPKIALDVVQFYSRMDQAQTRLKWLPRDSTRPYEYGPDWVLTPAIRAVMDIEPTLREIERFADLPASAAPDLKAATDAQEMEDLKNEP